MSQPARTQIFLNSPKDWDEWILLLETEATRQRIWVYVNPKTPLSELPKLTEPVRPNAAAVRALFPAATGVSTPARSISSTPAPEPPVTKSTLKPAERDLYDELYEDYLRSYKEYKKKEQALLDLRVRIQESVRREFLLAYCRGDNSYEILVALRDRLAQTPEHKEHDLLVRWNNLKEYKKGQDIETWLQKWETMYDDCVKIGLPDVSKKRGILAFVVAIHSIEPGFSDMMKAKLIGSYRDNDPQKAFRETLSDFREWRRISQYKNKPRGSYSAFGATLNNRTPGGASSSTHQRLCVCGESHDFVYCLYLIPSKRPAG